VESVALLLKGTRFNPCLGEERRDKDKDAKKDVHLDTNDEFLSVTAQE
jgi:hypothetical protein